MKQFIFLSLLLIGALNGMAQENQTTLSRDIGLTFRPGQNIIFLYQHQQTEKRSLRFSFSPGKLNYQYNTNSAINSSYFEAKNTFLNVALIKERKLGNQLKFITGIGCTNSFSYYRLDKGSNYTHLTALNAIIGIKTPTWKNFSLSLEANPAIGAIFAKQNNKFKPIYFIGNAGTNTFSLTLFYRFN